jgi:hypothetical protein
LPFTGTLALFFRKFFDQLLDLGEAGVEFLKGVAHVLEDGDKVGVALRVKREG